MKKLEGLIAAPHTPFTADGKVNLDLIPKQVETLLKQKVIGAYVCGTTGEGICCSVDERKQVMKAWVDAAEGRLFLIAHVGALSVVDARELAAYAQEIGMGATSIVPPNFFRPGSVDALIDDLNAVLVAAPDLPFYYYHTGMSGVNFDMEQFLLKADGRIPQLAGIKFNYPDLYMFQRCLRACGGKYDITWGIDPSPAARSPPSARPTTTPPPSTTASGRPTARATRPPSTAAWPRSAASSTSW